MNTPIDSILTNDTRPLYEAYRRVDVALEGEFRMSKETNFLALRMQADNAAECARQLAARGCDPRGLRHAIANDFAEYSGFILD